MGHSLGRLKMKDLSILMASDSVPLGRALICSAIFFLPPFAKSVVFSNIDQ